MSQNLEPCVAGLSESGVCAHADCAAAHEVACCGDCREFAHCMSGCGYPGKPEPEEIRVWVKAPGRAPEIASATSTSGAMRVVISISSWCAPMALQMSGFSLYFSATFMPSRA